MATVEMILSRLNGVRSNRGGWMARCPAHEDHNPSLSVRENNGKILVHCFAGCTAEAICAALQIEMRDLFSEPCPAREPEPIIVRKVQRHLIGLRTRLSPRERELAVTVVLADEVNLGAAITRALALTVEGELVQVALDGEAQ